MENPRWWNVAISGVSVVCIAFVLVNGGNAAQFWTAAITLTVMTGCWFLFGHRGFTDQRAAWAYLGVIIVAAGVLVSVMPSLAIIQCVMLPLAWVLTEGIASAIFANVAIVAAVSTGFIISIGMGPEAVATVLVNGVLSLVFSIALGLWITSIVVAGKDKARLLEQLTEAQSTVKELSRQGGVLEERERLAREIHDTIAQSLTGVVMLAERARRSGESQVDAELAENLELIESTARYALAEARSLVAETAPVGLGDGLAEALLRLAARFERETGIETTISVDDPVSLGMDSEVVLLRCAQEALANVRKHANASSARIVLRVVDGAVELQVSDDGVGPGDLDATERGFGIAGMRDRLGMAGGRLDISRGASGGTTVLARLAVGA